MRLIIAGLALFGAAYLAWCHTEEGRFCGRMVRAELAQYRKPSVHVLLARKVHSR